MATAPQPIDRLAGRQTPFSSEHGTALARRIRDAIELECPTAACVGVANGDQPAYCSRFEAATDIAGMEDRRVVRASFSSADVAIPESADIVSSPGDG